MKTTTLTLFLTLIANISLSQNAILLENVNIVNLEKKRIDKNKSILVVDNKIVDVSKTKRTLLKKFDGKIIDCKGSYAIPSLVDMHHHMTMGDFNFSGGGSTKKQLEVLEQLVLYGVQAILNPNNPIGVSSEVIEKVKDKANKYPFTYFTGPSIAPKNGGWGSYYVENNTEVIKIIDSLHSLKFRHVKFTYDDMSWLGGEHPIFDKELMKFLINYAHSKDMKVLVHVADLEKAKTVLRLGVDGLVHGIVTEKVDDEFLKLMQKNNAIYIPTATIYETSFNFQKSVKRQFKFDVWNSYTEKYEDSLTNDASNKQWNTWWPKAESLKYQLENLYFNTKKVQESGNILITGTDAGTPGVITGVSIYNELSLTQKAGVDTFEILKATIKNPLEFLGLYKYTGELKKNKLANLIIMKKNPIDDIDNINSSWLILYKGKIVSKK
ncbi:amidohydrolase family protein [Pontimicrobium aquaticum]|nr:amidohydrolase family protein [Pontimicrobium aquaticum]